MNLQQHKLRTLPCLNPKCIPFAQMPSCLLADSRWWSWEGERISLSTSRPALTCVLLSIQPRPRRLGPHDAWVSPRDQGNLCVGPGTVPPKPQQAPGSDPHSSPPTEVSSFSLPEMLSSELCSSGLVDSG